jgi:hypothetical protein
MNLFDEAYLITKQRVVAETSEKELSLKFPQFPIQEIAIAVQKARDLINYAEHCADMVRKEKLEENEALKEIKRAHPGFADETYGYALNHGFFLTR